MKNKAQNFIPFRPGTKHLFVLAAILLVNIHVVLSQSDSINISLNDTTVEAALLEIRNQSDMNFVFNHEQLKDWPRISINIKNKNVEEALQECLKGTGLTFEKVNNTIVIKPKDQSIFPSTNSDERSQTLRGQVVDRDSKAGIAFANILVLNTYPSKGAITDIDGYYKIDALPIGRYTLQVSYVGYEKAVLSEIQIGSAKEKVIDIELAENTQSVDEVIVTVKKGQALNEMANISGRSFSVEETKRYPASISDPARMAQVFAGVSTSDDASNEIVIRGNSPNWMLWRLEGVEIPSPNHFAEEGYTSGAVSILSTNMLGKSDFYTSAFPAEYGSAISGVFDLRLRNGNNEKREYSAQVGVLGLEFAAEGPLKKGYRGSYLVNYRYSTLSLLNNLGLEVSENTLPNYQDFSFKVNLPTKKAGTFSVWGIGGNSYADEKYYPDTTLNEDLEYGYTDDTKTGMMATGIGHTFFIDHQSYLKSVVAYSQNSSSNSVGNMDSTGIMKDDYFDDFSSGAIRLNTYYNRKLSGKLTVRTGLTLSGLHYNYFTKDLDSLDVWQTTINGKGNTSLYQAYAQTKYRLNDQFTFTAGLHYTHFSLSQDNSLEPRLGLTVQLKNSQKLGFGFGMHSKNENLPVYFVEFQNPDGSVSYLNKSLKLTRSSHYALSYEKFFNQNLSFKTEVYYQAISDLPVPNNPDKPLSPAFNGVNPNDTLINAGEGKNYGIEFTFQKYFTHNYYFLVTHSLFESKYKPIDGNWYNTRFNINYITNIVGGKEFELGKHKMLSLNGKLLWSGGKPFVPIDLEASKQEGEAVYDFNEMYKQRGKDYLRLDLGIKLHFYREKAEHIIALDVQNVTNRFNTWYKIYDSKNEEIIDYPMAGIIPILSYRIEF